jgi:hypothetical protein
MEPDVEVQQVIENVSRDSSDRALCDLGEHGVPQLGEQPGTDSS